VIAEQIKKIHTWCIRISCEWHVVNSRLHNENYVVLCHCVFCLHWSLTLWAMQWLYSKSHYIHSNLYRHNSETKDDTHTKWKIRTHQHAMGLQWWHLMQILQHLVCPQIIILWATIFTEQHQPQHNGKLSMLHECKLPPLNIFWKGTAL
jgi:hypothetical protein